MTRFEVNRDSPVPAYYQIMLHLKDRISHGEWRAGGRLPSEPELAEQYSVSRMTLRQAMAALAQEGLLTRRPGVGTFVNQGYIAPAAGMPATDSVRPQVDPDKLSLRQSVWEELRRVALPDARLHWNFEEFVPDFIGSERCAAAIAEMEWYRISRVVFIAPDNSLCAMREQAIRDDKQVIVPTYSLQRGFRLVEAGTVPEAQETFAATLDGLDRFSRPISLEEIARLGVDLMVTGISLVTLKGVRWGKGHGYFDLEWGMLRDVGAIAEGTPVIAVGHDCQLVPQDIEPSVVDTIADVIVVPSEVIQVEKVYAKPPGILWEYVSPELRQEIPPLQELFMKQHTLAAILDWFSRYVLSWALDLTLEIGFVLDAVRAALVQASPLILNSDQGSHFTSPQYTSLLIEAEVQISMDGRGRALDNVFTERLWRSVKDEEVYLNDYAIPRQARTGLARYFQFYNHERPHQALAYRTPAEIYFQTGDQSTLNLLPKLS